MAMRLYMHMGWPKTGTTSIQRFLYKNRLRLLELGYCYPSAHVPPYERFDYYYENQIWALRAYDGPLPDHDWQYYRDVIYREIQERNLPVCLISAEMGIYEHTDDLAFWKERFDVKPIYYLRNYFDFLVKVQQEYIKYTLTPAVFTMAQFRNNRMLAAVKYQIPFFGRDNCIFVDYDKVAREGNLIGSFLFKIGLKDDKDWEETEKANITPSEAHINALFQLSFVPMKLHEAILIRQELKKIDFDRYGDFRSNTLPPEIFNLDEYAHWALKYQGELLNDASWYEKNITRCEELAKKSYEDLPSEIQFYILENLSEEARTVLKTYLPAIHKASPSREWLPTMRGWSKSRHLILPLYFTHIKNERAKQRQRS